MFESIAEKISSLVHHHREKRSEAGSSVPVVEEIPVSKNWDFEITFVGGKNVPIGDIIASDPFLVAYLGPSDDQNTLSFITGVHWRTVNPEWNAKWNVQNVSDGTVLEMSVMDKDKMKEDTHLGKATLILGPQLEGFQEHTIDIIKPDGHTRGTITVHTTGKRTTGKAAASDKPTTTGPARYSRHTSYAAGILTHENKCEFYAYRVRLYHILEVFGSDPAGYQHWNVDYDAAKRIFGDNLEGANIRNALHSQHSYLYRHDRKTEYGALTFAEDLGNLLHGNRLKKDPQQDLKTVVFTYSIIPKGLYFSETGTAFFQDFMSKHAMHANRATEVCFSGEFRLFQDENHNNDWTLLIDNNSGTYSPKKEDLHKVREIFERNFPDLVVVALDHDDPYLKVIRDETKRIEALAAEQQKQRFSLFGGLNSSTEEIFEA